MNLDRSDSSCKNSAAAFNLNEPTGESSSGKKEKKRHFVTELPPISEESLIDRSVDESKKVAKDISTEFETSLMPTDINDETKLLKKKKKIKKEKDHSYQKESGVDGSGSCLDASACEHLDGSSSPHKKKKKNKSSKKESGMDDHGSSFDVSGCVILDGSSSSHKKKKKSKEGDCLNDFDSSVIGLKSTSSIVSDTEDEAKLHKKKKNKSSKKESGMDDHGSSFDVSGCVILDGSSSSHKKKKKSKEGDCLNDFDSSVIGLKSTSSIVSDTEDEAKLHKKKKNKSSKKESGMDDHGSSFDVSATDYLDFKRKKSRKEKDVSNESVLNITTDDPQKPSRKKEKNKDLKSGDESMAIDHESLFNTFSESRTTFKRKHKKNEIEDSAGEPYTKKIKSADSNDNASDSAMRAQSNETNGGPISSTNTLGVNDKSISAKNNNMSIVGIRDKNVSEVTARNSKSSESQKIRKRALFNANSSFLSFPKAPVKSELSASPEKVRRTLASESDQQRVPQGSSMNVKNELTSPSKEMKGNPSQTK